MDNDEEDGCLITYGPKVLRDVAQSHSASAQVIDVHLGHLAVNLDQHHSAAKMLKACLDI